MAHYRVPPFPFSLSIMSKKQAATVVVSVNEIYQGICRVKRRQSMAMLGTVTMKGQMEEEEPFKGLKQPGQWDTHQESGLQMPKGKYFKRQEVAKYC